MNELFTIITKKSDIDDFLELVKKKGKFNFTNDKNYILITFDKNTYRYREGKSGLMARINPNNLKQIIWKNRKYVNYELKKKCKNCKYSKTISGEELLKCNFFGNISDMDDDSLKLMLIGSSYNHKEFGISDEGYLLVHPLSKCDNFVLSK